MLQLCHAAKLSLTNKDLEHCLWIQIILNSLLQRSSLHISTLGLKRLPNQPIIDVINWELIGKKYIAGLGQLLRSSGCSGSQQHQPDEIAAPYTKSTWHAQEGQGGEGPEGFSRPCVATMALVLLKILLLELSEMLLWLLQEQQAGAGARHRHLGRRPTMLEGLFSGLDPAAGLSPSRMDAKIRLLVEAPAAVEDALASLLDHHDPVVQVCT